MEVIKAKVYGFCQGVKYALNYLNKVSKDCHNEEIYLLGNLVHNEILMDDIKSRGIHILNDGTLKERIDSINQGIIIFSAHGHDPKLDIYAKSKGLKVFDATCPRVIKNMDDIKKSLNAKHKVFYIGVKDHEETNAALSLGNIHFIDYHKPNIERCSLDTIDVFNQTTLSTLALESIHNEIKKKCQNVILHNDICNATFERQIALNNISKDIYYIIVLGDKSSSNTKRLKEIAREKYLDKEVLLFSSLDEVKKFDFDKTKKIFLTAGASTPDEIIIPIEKYLLSL